MSPPTAVVRSVVVMGGTRVMLGCVVGLLVVCGAWQVHGPPLGQTPSFGQTLGAHSFVGADSTATSRFGKKSRKANLPPASLQKRGQCPSLSAELRFDKQPTTRCRVLRASVLRGGNGPEQWHRKVGETWSTTLVWCSLLVVGDVDAHWVLCVCE